MVKGTLTALVAAVLLVPAAAAARTATTPSLALLTLPKNAIGAAAKNLSVARDSGVVSNADAASQSTGNVTPARLKTLGRITGYLLDYGSPFTDGPGIHQVQTEVEQYRSATDAAKALAFWRKDATDTGQLKKMGIDATSRKASVPAVGSGRWAYNQDLHIPGLPPLHGYSAQILDGVYLLDISVSAGTSSAAARIGPVIARKLDARYRLAQSGHLTGKPVALPAPLKVGPPPHGPAPSKMVLKAADFTGKTQVRAHYVPVKGSADRNALSAYDVQMLSNGPLSYVSQEVTCADGPKEATYIAAVTAAALTSPGTYGAKATATVVDISSVGDDGHGVLIQLSVQGHKVYEAAVELRRGSYINIALAGSRTALGASDVQSFAAKVAQRFDAGF